jgi:hypothetical protein
MVVHRVAVTGASKTTRNTRCSTSSPYAACAAAKPAASGGRTSTFEPEPSPSPFSSSTTTGTSSRASPRAMPATGSWPWTPKHRPSSRPTAPPRTSCASPQEPHGSTPAGPSPTSTAPGRTPMGIRPIRPARPRQRPPTDPAPRPTPRRGNHRPRRRRGDEGRPGATRSLLAHPDLGHLHQRPTAGRYSSGRGHGPAHPPPTDRPHRRAHTGHTSPLTSTAIGQKLITKYQETPGQAPLLTVGRRGLEPRTYGLKVHRS